jgi:hypothetical protein
MKKIIVSLLSASIAVSLLNVIARPALANLWAGAEKTGECMIPNRQTTFTCQFGSYFYQTKEVSNARQIGGFYINPKHQFGGNGVIPIQYRVNGGNWMNAQVTLNQTNGNYIDFGDGVKSFDFRILRPADDSLGGGSTIYFKFNYDLDR